MLPCVNTTCKTPLVTSVVATPRRLTSRYIPLRARVKLVRPRQVLAATLSQGRRFALRPLQGLSPPGPTKAPPLHRRLALPIPCLFPGFASRHAPLPSRHPRRCRPTRALDPHCTAAVACHPAGCTVHTRLLFMHETSHRPHRLRWSDGALQRPYARCWRATPTPRATQTFPGSFRCTWRSRPGRPSPSLGPSPRYKGRAFDYTLC